jgi:hypothetical protein
MMLLTHKKYQNIEMKMFWHRSAKIFYFADFKVLLPHDEGLSVHIPITDEGCRGKYTWCADGQLVKPEVAAALNLNKFGTNLKPGDSRNCVYAYVKKTGGYHTEVDLCDRAKDFNNKKYVCEIPA